MHALRRRAPFIKNIIGQNRFDTNLIFYRIFLSDFFIEIFFYWLFFYRRILFLFYRKSFFLIFEKDHKLK